MVSFTSALVLFTTLATTATYVAANPSGVLHELVARQSFDPSAIPQQCQDQCASLLSSVTSSSCSTDLKCICGNDIAKKTQQCAQCDASIIGEGAANDLYQKYADACEAGGIKVPSFTSSSGGASNLQISAAGVIGSTALAFFLTA